MFQNGRVPIEVITPSLGNTIHMMKRFILLAFAVTALFGLVVYSKWQLDPARVSGIIEADEIRLGSRVGGRVALVHVQEGQLVEKGMVLVELEPYDLLEREQGLALSLAAKAAEFERVFAGYREEEKLQAKARVDQLQARLDVLIAGPREQEIKAAQGRLTRAEAEQKLAEQALQRVSKLADNNASSKKELDSAREAQEASSANQFVREQELELLLAGTRDEEKREAKARLEEARQALLMMERGFRKEEVAQAKASRDAAQAALDAIQRQKEELLVRSPINGTVEALELQPGDMVAPGAPIISMLDQNHLWIRAYIPQNRMSVQVGQKVRLTIDSHPDAPWTGTISFVARQAEFTPSNVQTPEERAKQVFRTKILIDDNRNLLRAGMMADVWLDELDGADQ